MPDSYPTEPEPPETPRDNSLSPPARATNGWAVASTIVGFCGCIPFVPGLVALFLGIVGIRKSHNSRIGSGKGLAIVGMFLGSLSILAWGFYGTFLTYGYIESKPAGVIAKQFLKDVDSGNISGAKSISLFSQAQLQHWHDQMTAFRGLQSINISSFKVTTTNGQMQMQLGGTASFVKGTGTCTFVLIKVNGAFKVTTFWVQ